MRKHALKAKYMAIWLVVGVVVAAGLGYSQTMSNVEQAPYTVIEKSGAIERRDYPALIVAQAQTEGERKEAINQGFRLIADYIFGNNLASHKVAMTAPVLQQASEKIAMTAPVLQQASEGKKWTVQFVMPAQYTMETLPKPNNAAVTLHALPAKQTISITFSGIASPKKLELKTQELRAFALEKKLTAIGSPTYAFFNPPWTLPPLRRNEVMLEIKPVKD